MTRNAEIRNNTVAKGQVAKIPVFIDRSCPKTTITLRDNSLI